MQKSKMAVWGGLKNSCEMKRYELQNEYDFEIPKYILSQLIKPSYNKTNVAALINLAVMNDRFTSEDGRLLKNKYCKTN